MDENKGRIEQISGEEESYSNDDLYNISSWGADLSFREIISMYEEGDLIKPELQRKYVWSKQEASRFIDSILLGLPVPSVFFAKKSDETKLIVDGYQRIMTVFDYVNGIFSKDNTKFSLSKDETINPRWRGKTFEELTKEEQRKIRTTTIHAIIFEQKEPQNDSGMYQVFERINTGGRTLKPQEIRNCVYQGEFNKLLFELNKNQKWRSVINKDEDPRMADLELILRYFAIKDFYNKNEIIQQINLINFLNTYMGDHQKLSNSEYKNYRDDFVEVITVIDKEIGNSAFRNLKKNKKEFANKVSPSILDAVMVATRKAIVEGKDIKELKDKYTKLCSNEEFINVTSQRTTDAKNIRRRIDLAFQILYNE